MNGGGGGRFWSPGTRTSFSTCGTPTCEEFWGAEATGYPAETFAPDRWDVLAQKGRSSRELMHFGFGHGPRICPGKFLGLLEVALVVGAFVKLFTFTAVNERMEARAGVSTKPADGVWVDLSLR